MRFKIVIVLAHQKGFDLAMDIFHLTKNFPNSEVFGLSSQMFKPSRAVCSAIAEGYRKRKYESRFNSKLSDVDSEIQKLNYG